MPSLQPDSPSADAAEPAATFPVCAAPAEPATAPLSLRPVPLPGAPSTSRAHVGAGAAARRKVHAVRADPGEGRVSLDTRVLGVCGQAQGPCTSSLFGKCQGTSGDILRPSNIQCLHLIPHTPTSETPE